MHEMMEWFKLKLIAKELNQKMEIAVFKYAKANTQI